MRLITLATLLIVATGCGTAKKASNNNTSATAKLDGTWAPIKEEMGGKAFPEAILKTQRLTLADSTYTMTAESTDKGVVRYNGNKMDIYGREGVNKGQHYTALYKYENDELTICYNLDGSSYPETFDTKGKPMFFMAVFKRASSMPNVNNEKRPQQVQHANLPDK